MRQGRDRFEAVAAHCADLSRAASLVDALAARHGFAGASHLSWAVRSGSGGSVSEAKSDGGESGAGGCILDVMRRTGSTDLLILVARWYGGRHLGPLRFRIYRRLAGELAQG